MFYSRVNTPYCPSSPILLHRRSILFSALPTPSSSSPYPSVLPPPSAQTHHNQPYESPLTTPNQPLDQPLPLHNRNNHRQHLARLHHRRPARFRAQRLDRYGVLTYVYRCLPPPPSLSLFPLPSTFPAHPSRSAFPLPASAPIFRSLIPTIHASTRPPFLTSFPPPNSAEKAHPKIPQASSLFTPNSATSLAEKR